MLVKFCVVISVFVSAEYVAGYTWNDKKCEQQLNSFSNALTNRELWALESRTSLWILNKDFISVFYVDSV